MDATVFAVSISRDIRGTLLYVAAAFRQGVPQGCRGLCAMTLSGNHSDASAQSSQDVSGTWSEVGGGVSGGAVLVMLSVLQGQALVVGGSFYAVGGGGETGRGEGGGGG